ncbi:MAG: class II aldolase/adducin family protein [Cyanobium sp.]
MSSVSAATEPEDAVESLRRELCITMAAIHRRGWCEGTGGNFSCVIQRDPLQLLMAPSGVDKGTVRAAALIVVDAEGRVLQGVGRVSAELALHREIVRRCGAGAVLHTHSQAATLLSRATLRRGGTAEQRGDRRRQEGGNRSTTGRIHIEGLEMLKGLEGLQTHDCSIDIPVLANDQDLQRLSDEAGPHLGGAPHGILIAGHGLYAWGQDVQQARRHLEILEFLLEQHWREQLWNALSDARP